MVPKKKNLHEVESIVLPSQKTPFLFILARASPFKLGIIKYIKKIVPAFDYFFIVLKLIPDEDLGQVAIYIFIRESTQALV